FEQASATEVTILLDLERHAQRGGSGKRSSLESAVKIAASLARHALAGGHAVQIAGRSREWLALPSRTGESQLHLILDHLARVEARGPLPFHEAVAQAASLVGAAGTVFFIFPSPNFDTAAFAALFALFRSRGTRMIAVVLEQPPISGQPGAGEDAPPRLPRECADCFLLSGVSYTVFSRRTPWENLFDNLVTAA
ncbi:MAG: DUF58 domain-containing protein, partial [Planctomycetes bacterium]|nr:DUF58 domain-containing protein [Planctomycetota bacterium]